MTQRTRWIRQHCPLSPEGELLDLLKLWPDQHFTQPPPRYTEATLVKTMEEQGIGRPSTYAPIISTIQERGYVVRRRRSSYPPTWASRSTTCWWSTSPKIVDVGFTSNMEEELDEIAAGTRPWVPVIARVVRAA